MNRIFLILLIFILMRFSLWSERIELTADQAVELASAENLQLKQSAIALRISKRLSSSWFNLFIPSIEATGTFSGNEQITTNSNSSVKDLSNPGALGLRASGTATLPIYVGIVTGVVALNRAYRSGLISYQLAKKTLERDVRKQFYLILVEKENISIQKSNIDLAEKRLERAKNNFDLGLVAELDVTAAKVSLANLLPKYNRVLALYENQLLTMRLLLGVDEKDEIVLDGSLINEFIKFDPDTLIDKHLGKRLDLAKLSMDILSQKSDAASYVLNANTPKITLGYNYEILGSNADATSGNPAPIDPWTNWIDKGTISLTLRWKLDGFIPGSSTDVVARNKWDNIKSLQLGRQIAEKKAVIEISQLVNNLNTSIKTIEANEIAVKQSVRNYELTDEAYKVGSRDFLEVETAQNNLLVARQQLVLSRYEYVAALLDLELALNTPRDEF